MKYNFFLKYKDEFTEYDFLLKDNPEVYHKVVFSSENKIIIVFPQYPKLDNHLSIVFGCDEKTEKYIFDLSNDRYQEYLIELLREYDFGNSKLMQLITFNKIQEVVAHYYIDIKKQKCIYSEASKNSLFYSMRIHAPNDFHKNIKVCIIDEESLFDSFKRRMAKVNPNDLLSFSNWNFIYLMHNKKNNLYKIGFSKKPAHREKTLNSEEPTICLYRTWITSQKYESILKKKYQNKRVRGEWFSLSKEDLDEIDAKMSKFYKSEEDALMGSASKFLSSLIKN